jgi:hypothetical protein
MRREIRELDLLDLSRPPAGSVASWVKTVIGCAALAAIVVTLVAGRAIWNMVALELELLFLSWERVSASRGEWFWFQNGPALASAAMIAAVLVLSPRGARAVRLATLFPILLLAGMLAAWAGWAVIAPHLTSLRKVAPLLVDLPIGAVLAATAAATCLAALAVCLRGGTRGGTRGPGAWMRTVVVVALVDLLLLGLWLPLASWWWGRDGGLGWDPGAGNELGLGSLPRLLALALAPPLLGAAAFAALVQRRPALALRTRRLWTTALVMLFGAAVLARLTDSDRGYLVYLNLVHFLLASAFVAAAALVAFVASLGLRGRSARRRLARERAPVIGVIAEERDDSSTLVACLQLEGWLAGPRALVDSFEVTTPVGRIPIPAGAELVAALPAVSTVLHVGEAVAVLRRGDRVVVGGLITPPADHPFRSSGALVPGPDGIVVRRHDDTGDGFASIELVAWRPCVAFLLILSAVAIPGLAATLALL